MNHAKGFLIYGDDDQNSSDKRQTSTRLSVRKNFLLDVRDIYSSYNIDKLIGKFIIYSFFNYSNIIEGANPFKFSFNGMKNEILNSTQVLKAIDEVVTRNPNISLSAAKLHAKELLDSMISIPNERIMRGLCYIVQKILKRLYKTVNVIESQIQQVCRPY